MAYSYTMGPQYSLGAQKIQQVIVTADAATGTVVPFPAGTQVIPIGAASRGATASAWGVSYNIATGALFFVGGAAATVEALCFLP